MQNVIRRWLPWYCVLSGALLLLALLNEGLNVGGAWRWGRFDNDPSVLAAVRMTFFSEAIDWYGPALANHMKALAAFTGLLSLLLILWFALRGRFANLKLPVVSILLTLSIVPAMRSALHLSDSFFEWNLGSRHGIYHWADIELRPFLENGKVGFKNSKDQIVIPARFDCADRPSGTSEPAGIVVGVGDKQTLINVNGQEFFPLIYDEISSLRLSRDWIRAKYQGKWGFIDYRGRIKLPFQYEALSEMSATFVNQPLAAFRSGTKWGYIDKAGKVILQPRWDFGYGFSRGVAAVKRDGKNCYINEAGNEVVPCEFDSVTSFFDGKSVAVPDLFWIELGKKVGVYDSRFGRIAIPAEYDQSLASTKVERVAEGYIITPSQFIPAQRDATAILVAIGEKPDIPWARFYPDKEKPKGPEYVGFSKSRTEGSSRPPTCISSADN